MVREQCRVLLDEQGVLVVWQFFCGYVFQMVVLGGGFVQLGEKPLVFQGWWRRHQTVLVRTLDNFDSETWRGAGRWHCVAPDIARPGIINLESTSNHYKIIWYNNRLNELTNICLKLHSNRKLSKVPSSSDDSCLPPSTTTQNYVVYGTSLTSDSSK